MTYFDELTSAMTWLGEKDAIFIGQSVAYPGNTIFKSLKDVPMSKRLELPVMEDGQLGMSIGMAIAGKNVVTIFPRMDFLLCATNQLVNHLDKNIYPLKGRLIIRTCIGATTPLYPGVQHCGDYSEMFSRTLKYVNVATLELTRTIADTYKKAWEIYDTNVDNREGRQLWNGVILTIHSHLSRDSRITRITRIS